MARFISADRLRAAIDRLRQSRASGGMVNFLILKRAVKLAANKPVNLSTKDAKFQQAITDIAYWPGDENSDEVRPFIDVFGSIKAKSNGLKKSKYRSNGPADTLKNGTWRPVVNIAEGDKSKMANLQDDYRKGLKDLVILKDEARPMPTLQDAAVWYFRGKDVSSITGQSSDNSEIESKLADAFCKELDLHAEDLAILFKKEQDDAE
ncbi:MAG: hypothetical protein ACKOAU_16280 [Pirellula sp.]